MSTSAREPRLAELIARHHGEVHPEILRYLLQWLLLMRESFDGDLDAMVVMAVIGDRMLKDPQLRQGGYDAMRHAPSIKPQIALPNRKSIADSTGIPRETVRRKVATLLARGWINEQSDGTLVPTRAAAEGLHTTTLHSFEILGRLGEALAAARDIENQQPT